MGTLFKPLQTGPSKLKGGFYGEAGSGKTYTAAQTLIGLHKFMKSKKPIYFLDTEKGASFVKKSLFDPAGVPLEVLTSRDFRTMKDAIRESEREAFGLIVDSISSIWDQFKKKFLEDTKQKFIELWDWQPLKAEWAEFTNLYLNSNTHIILCGRAASIYEQSEEVRGGKTKKVAHKVGTKMKSESEQGYEPNLLCEMEKVHEDESGLYIRRCHVIKDRFAIIDSKDFDNPRFEDFWPHIEMLDLGATETSISNGNPDEKLFDMNGDGELAKRGKRRGILCEEIQALIVQYFPGTTVKEKKIKIDLLLKLFGVRAWKSVEEDWKAVPLEKLEAVMLVDPTDKLCPLEKEMITIMDALGLSLTKVTDPQPQE
jgi:hypothetical protein